MLPVFYYQQRLYISRFQCLINLLIINMNLFFTINKCLIKQLHRGLQGDNNILLKNSIQFHILLFV